MKEQGFGALQWNNFRELLRTGTDLTEFLVFVSNIDLAAAALTKEAKFS